MTAYEIKLFEENDFTSEYTLTVRYNPGDSLVLTTDTPDERVSFVVPDNDIEFVLRNITRMTGKAADQ